jgi:two-component system response regulator YesN
MYKVVIADDEKIIREGIASSIDWEKFGCKIAGMADDGLQGWQMILAERADVALLDIKMPILTGVQVAEKIYREKLGTKAILLSGYAEFAYARECMKYGVRHYLLKPAGIDEIEGALQSCINEIPPPPRLEGCGQRGGLPWPEDGGQYSRNTLIAVKYVAENLFRPELTLRFLSNDVLGLNADYFGKMFRRETGRYFTQFVIEQRIEKAKKLLATSNERVYEIARQVGFAENAAYFGQVFKRFAGMTPQAYREKHWRLP